MSPHSLARLRTRSWHPGGPYASGLSYSTTVQMYMPELRPTTNYVSFDQRGLGQSSHAECEYEYAPDDGRSAEAQAIGEACSQDADVATMTTEQAAYDMDFIRHLLGLESVTYMGYSYGTWLGTWFGSLFSGNIDRMVLDSATDSTQESIQTLYNAAHEGRDRQFRLHMMNWTDGSGDPRGIGYSHHRSDGPARRATRRGARTSRTACRRPCPRTGRDSPRHARLRDRVHRVHGRPVDAGPRLLGGVQRAHGPGRAADCAAGLLVTPTCAFWPTDSTMPPLDDSFPQTIVLQSELDSMTPFEQGWAAGTGLPNTSLIAVDNESIHGVFPYGTEEVDQPVIDFLLGGDRPARTIVAAAKPLPLEQSTYESWTPLDENAEHHRRPSVHRPDHSR